MFNQDDNKTKYMKTKDYNYLDGLFFLFMFSSLYEDIPFEIDDELKELLVEVTYLTKKEYDCKNLNNIPNQNIEEILKYVQNDIEDSNFKLDKMNHRELKALQKQSYVTSKKIYNMLEAPFDIEPNEISQKISDLSFFIACAQTKKEQDALFAKQDALFAQEEKESSRIKKSIENHINKISALSACFTNSQYTYHMPVKTKAQKIRSYFESKSSHTEECKERNSTCQSPHERCAKLNVPL